MTKALQKLTQIRKPKDFDDTQDQTWMDAVEVDAENYEEITHALLTQFKRIIHGSAAGNWFANPPISLTGLVGAIDIDRLILTTEGGVVYDDAGEIVLKNP